MNNSSKKQGFCIEIIILQYCIENMILFNTEPLKGHLLMIIIKPPRFPLNYCLA